MASATANQALSMPIYTVVALCGFVSEVMVKLLANVAGARGASPAATPAPARPARCHVCSMRNVHYTQCQQAAATRALIQTGARRVAAAAQPRPQAASSRPQPAPQHLHCSPRLPRLLRRRLLSSAGSARAGGKVVAATAAVPAFAAAAAIWEIRDALETDPEKRSAMSTLVAQPSILNWHD